MEQKVGEMVTPGIHAIHLNVKHVRQPRHGMPIGCVACGEGPQDALPGQPADDWGVFANILGIIKRQKSVVTNWGINEQNDHDQDSRNPHHGFVRDRIGRMHRMILAPGFGRFSACTGHGLPGFGYGPIAVLFTASHFDKVSCKRKIESSSRENSIFAASSPQLSTE